MSLVEKLVAIREIQADIKAVMSAKEVSLQDIFNVFNYVYNSTDRRELMNLIAETITLTDYMQYKMVFDGIMYEKYLYVNFDKREYYNTATNGTIHIVGYAFSNNFVPSMIDFIKEKVDQKLITSSDYSYYGMKLQRIKCTDLLIQLTRMD